jgi:hypothetical protein
MIARQLGQTLPVPRTLLEVQIVVRSSQKNSLKNVQQISKKNNQQKSQQKGQVPLCQRKSRRSRWKPKL